MNLVVDIGNTRAKAAVFVGDQIQKAWVVEKSTLEQSLLDLRNQFPQMERALVSSVAEDAKHLIGKSLEGISVMELLATTPLNFDSRYDDLTRLGADRKALVAAAVTKFSGKAVLVIDMGSCVTYDLVDANKMHHGGGISAGWSMRLKAMHEQTSRLPLLNTTEAELVNDGSVMGTYTEAAMHRATFNGLVDEIDGAIDRYRQEYPDLTVILTGGDAAVFSVRLKNGIFAHSNFLLEGLNALLQHNT
ncbi:MAG: type III pantothenate kinase [Bacteroidetes bacterium]|nr:type III pantothenate kinase [Bacteroidota bacterium]